MLRRRCVCALLVVAALLVAGCGSDDESSADQPDPTAGPAEPGGGGGDDGAGDDVGAAPADLGDFAIAVPPGGVVTGNDETGGIRVVFVTMPIGDVDAAISFYDDWTDDQADDYQRTEAEGGGVSWIGDGRVIQVLAPLEGDDEVLITLTVNGN